MSQGIEARVIFTDNLSKFLFNLDENSNLEMVILGGFLKIT